MKAYIQVEDRKEAAMIRAGLQDRTVRAVVLITGALRNLKSDRARTRVLRYVRDYLDDRDDALQRSIVPAEELET